MWPTTSRPRTPASLLEDHDDLHVVHLCGELDMVDADRLKEALIGVGRATVEIDLSRLTSAVLGQHGARRVGTFTHTHFVPSYRV